MIKRFISGPFPTYDAAYREKRKLSEAGMFDICHCQKPGHGWYVQYSDEVDDEAG